MDQNNSINTDNFAKQNLNAFFDNNILLNNDSDPDYNMFSENSYLTDIEAKYPLKINNSGNTLSSTHQYQYTKHK